MAIYTSLKIHVPYGNKFVEIDKFPFLLFFPSLGFYTPGDEFENVKMIGKI